MSGNNIKLVILVLFFPIFANCMTISVKDSITYDSDYQIGNLLKYGMRECAYQLMGK